MKKLLAWKFLSVRNVVKINRKYVSSYSHCSNSDPIVRVRGVDLLDEAQKISFPALAIDIDKQRDSLGVCERVEAGVGVCFVCELSILDQATRKSFERNDESKEFEPHSGFRYSNTKKSALQPLRASKDHQLFRRVSCPASSRDENSGTIRASKIGLPTIKSDETWRSPC